MDQPSARARAIQASPPSVAPSSRPVIQEAPTMRPPYFTRPFRTGTAATTGETSDALHHHAGGGAEPGDCRW